jgi:outer membrane protein OmpA-like peptidoglycan-associated protein
VTERAVLPAGRDAAQHEDDTPDEDLASLRSILIGPAERKIDALQSRLNDRLATARDVGAVLPQALLQRADDPDLARALTPPVEQAITASVRRDPRPLADALFPVIGPAIRKAVAASLVAMVESLNRSLEHSLSLRAMRWRLEAVRTGRSFGEVVLLHTLLYRVEQVFLIHRKMGLLLQHVRAGSAQVEDVQIVSAMLTAIRDFVQDSFHVSEQESLDALRVGELSVWIEQGPAAILASVIRGTAPPEHRHTLQRALEAIHLQSAGALEAFDGETSPFESARPALESCLETQYRAEPSRRRRGALILALVAVLAIAWWGAGWLRERRQWTRYLEALGAEPGLVVLSTGRRDGKYAVSGLRDPLARDPEAILRQTQLAPDEVVARWEPFQALTPTFVLARAQHALQPPAGTTVTLRGGVLTATGEPPAAWIGEARRIAPLIAGVAGFDTAGLLESRTQSLIRRIQAATVQFSRGSSRLLPGQGAQLQTLAEDLRELGRLAALADRAFRIDVVGHTDADGDDASNLPLSRARANQLIDALGLEPTARLELRPLGVASTEPLVSGDTDEGKQRNRRVSLRVAGAGQSHSR